MQPITLISLVSITRAKLKETLAREESEGSIHIPTTDLEEFHRLFPNQQPIIKHYIEKGYTNIITNLKLKTLPQTTPQIPSTTIQQIPEKTTPADPSVLRRLGLL